jgi:hypothetical protein
MSYHLPLHESSSRAIEEGDVTAADALLLISHGLENQAAKAHSHNVQRNLEVLQKLEGIDPVLAAVNGEPELVPKDGWLIRAKVTPGYSGVIEMNRYGTLTPLNVTDGREKWGEMRMGYTLDGCSLDTFVYENPHSPSKDFNGHLVPSHQEARDSQTIVPLENGGRILAKRGYGYHDQGQSTSSMISEIIAKEDAGGQPLARVNRVTDNEDELKTILLQLGYSMGLEPKGIEAFVATVENATDLN